MKNYLIFGLLIFGLLSCSKTKNKTIFIGEKNIRVAEINNESLITTNELDSLLSSQIYQLKLKTIENYGTKKILDLEAIRRNISVDKLIDNEIISKLKPVTKEDIELYKKKSGKVNLSYEKLKKEIELMNQSQRQQFFIDSLKKALNFKIKLLPTYLKKINTDSIFYFKINEIKSKNIVYVVSDFNCITCKESEIQLSKITNKYHNEVSFRFVYYSHYVNPVIYYSCKLADKDTKFSELKETLFQSQEILSDKNKLSEILNFDTNKKEEDLFQKSGIEIFKNKQYLMRNGVYSTPTFIVGGKILDVNHSIDILEEIIIREFKL